MKQQEFPMLVVEGRKAKKSEKSSRSYATKEYKLQVLRECEIPERMQLVDEPWKAVEFWRQTIETHEWFNVEVESLYVLLLNTRRRLKGYYLVSQGTLDSVLTSPRETYRLAVLHGSSAIILMHNHASGDPNPSGADIRVTRDIIRAGEILKIELLDHVIVGRGKPGFKSIRELGYFYR